MGHVESVIFIFVAAILKKTAIAKHGSNIFAVFIGMAKNVLQMRHSRVQRVEAKKKKKENNIKP